ncbi:MAG: IS110 family transposase [Chloroflexi bacterium]|nr:IS110 family transposase [Chloroflexota bacterium]
MGRTNAGFDPVDWSRALHRQDDLAAIGDIRRFASPQQLVGYAGLGARVLASGTSYHPGRITKQGRRELRTAFITCA